MFNSTIIRHAIRFSGRTSCPLTADGTSYAVNRPTRMRATESSCARAVKASSLTDFLQYGQTIRTVSPSERVRILSVGMSRRQKGQVNMSMVFPTFVCMYMHRPATLGRPPRCTGPMLAVSGRTVSRIKKHVGGQRGITIFIYALIITQAQ